MGHLIPAEKDADAFAAATIKFFRDYDWDWLKVNPRATYFAEAWGSEYDFQNYGRRLPSLRPQSRRPFGPRRPEAGGTDDEGLGGTTRGAEEDQGRAGRGSFRRHDFSPASGASSLVGRPTDYSQGAVTRAQAEELLRLIRNEPPKSRKRQDSASGDHTMRTIVCPAASDSKATD